MTHDEMIAVIQAHLAGKKIQHCYPIGRGHWVDTPNPSFRFHDTEYRVTPEPPKPREWWIYPIHGKTTCHIDTQPGPELVHVREVLPE